MKKKYFTEEEKKAAKAIKDAKYREKYRERVNTNSRKWYYEQGGKEKYQAWLKSDPRITLFHNAKERAKKKNQEFSITKDDIILADVCPLLGIDIVYNNTRVSGNSPSLDRKDSTQGYVKSNIWVISHKANTIKNNATLEELETIAKNWRKSNG